MDLKIFMPQTLKTRSIICQSTNGEFLLLKTRLIFVPMSYPYIPGNYIKLLYRCQSDLETCNYI